MCTHSFIVEEYSYAAEFISGKVSIYEDKQSSDIHDSVFTDPCDCAIICMYKYAYFMGLIFTVQLPINCENHEKLDPLKIFHYIY